MADTAAAPPQRQPEARVRVEPVWTDGTVDQSDEIYYFRCAVLEFARQEAERREIRLSSI
jgi:hypothetical protein